MELGPAQGTLKVRTGVAGSASRMGHRLVLLVEQWSAQVELDDGVPQSVVLTAELDSLQVESGTGGVTPLTVVDKQVIRRNASKVLDTEDFPQVTFESSELDLNDVAVAVSGTLTIHGESQPLEATLSVHEGRVQASIPVVQTDFGIRPYSAMLGQLKVSDEVTVDLDVLIAQ